MRGGREISLCAGRRIRRSECGRKSRPASFEMTGWRVGEAKRPLSEGRDWPAPFEMTGWRVGRGEKAAVGRARLACSDRNDGLAGGARRKGRSGKGAAGFLRYQRTNG